MQIMYTVLSILGVVYIFNNIANIKQEKRIKCKIMIIVFAIILACFIKVETFRSSVTTTSKNVSANVYDNIISLADELEEE